MSMRTLILQKKTGCNLEVIVFSNGKVASCWVSPAPVPEVATYDSIEDFFKVRSPERGYTVIFDSITKKHVAKTFDATGKRDDY